MFFKVNFNRSLDPIKMILENLELTSYGIGVSTGTPFCKIHSMKII